MECSHAVNSSQMLLQQMCFSFIVLRKMYRSFKIFMEKRKIRHLDTIADGMGSRQCVCAANIAVHAFIRLQSVACTEHIELVALENRLPMTFSDANETDRKKFLINSICFCPLRSRGAVQLLKRGKLITVPFGRSLESNQSKAQSNSALGHQQ